MVDLARRRDPEPLGQCSEIGDVSRVNGNAVRSADGLGRRLWFARHQHSPGGVGSGRRLGQPVKVVAEPFAENGRIADRARIDDKEELPEIRRRGGIDSPAIRLPNVAPARTPVSTSTARASP